MYKINIVRNGKSMYYKEHNKKMPIFSTNKNAQVFSSINKCKIIRDDCLEYVSQANIEKI